MTFQPVIGILQPELITQSASYQISSFAVIAKRFLAKQSLQKW